MAHIDVQHVTYALPDGRVLLDDVVQGCIYAQPLSAAFAARGIDVATRADLPLDDTVVRGWLHDRPATDLVHATMSWLVASGLAHGRLWWQTNERCTDQLLACDALGLTDCIAVPAAELTWLLRAAPSSLAD